MRKQMSRSLAGILTLFCLASLLGFRAHAASGRISYNDPSVTVGDQVNVNMTVTSDAGLGSLDATLTYDASLLEYVSGSGSGAVISGGSGSISISWTSTENPSSISFSFTFKTKATGTAKVTTSSADVRTLDEEGVSLTSTGSSAITISAPPTASSEARLSSLKVGSATLSPSFSPDTYEYTTTVPAGTKKLVISLSTKDSGAKYSISGTSLSVGSNTTTITVTAADGATKKTYTIRTTRPADPVSDPEQPEEPQEPETPEEPEQPQETPITVTVDGAVLYVARSLEGVTLPEGFESTPYTFRTAEISVAKGLGKPLILFWLTDETGANGAFYIYNEASGSFFRQTDITSGQKIYTVLPLPADVAVPDGYAETAVLIGAQEVTAWALPQEGEEPSEFVLVYAMNWNGETGFYRYDTVEQTMQRYAAETPEAAPEQEDDGERELLLAQNQELQAALNRAEEQVHNSKLLILLLAAASVVLLVLLICVLIFTNVRRRRPPTDGYQGHRSGSRDREEYPSRPAAEPEDDDFDFDFDF